MSIMDAPERTTKSVHERAMQSAHERAFQQKRSWRVWFSALMSIILLGVILSLLFLAIQQWQNAWSAPSNQLTITMLNIGQGDAILIRTPDKKDILIDAGPDRSILPELGRALPPWNRRIEYVMASHDDADHIGGMKFLTRQYHVEQWILSPTEKATSQSAEFREIVERAELPAMIPNTGDVIQLGEHVTFETLSPQPGMKHKDINDDSVTGILRYKDFSMLLTGDVADRVEDEWLDLCDTPCTALDVDVLKVGHHGSGSSTSRELLNATTPDTALISSGVENRYGHPHEDVLARLNTSQTEIWRTDLHGRVRCTTTGTDEFICSSEK